MHGLSSVDVKLSAASATSTQSIRRKDTLLTTRRQLRNALVRAQVQCFEVVVVMILKSLQQKNPFTTAANELKDAKAASAYSSSKKEPLLTTKRQLLNALILKQVRCTYAVGLIILISQQKTCHLAAKANELELRKATAQFGARKAGNQSGQHKANRSSKKADETLTPIAGRNIEAPALYVIKESLGKGFGMFAAKDIRKGTRILADKPFFSLTERPMVSLSDPQAPNDISDAFDCLSTHEQEKYLDLYCPQRPGWSRGISIYEANCYEMGSGTCICLDASRINHSCIPNAHYSWNSKIHRETVHAVKDITKDEEITISYCSTIRTLEERKRELEPYVFACSCPACQTNTDFGIESQIRRQHMRVLHRQTTDCRDHPPAARTECDHWDEGSAILKLISLINEEGLVYEKSLAYHDAAECALKRGLREEALIYASQELEVVFCCVGRDSPYYDETMTFVRESCLRAKDVAN